MPLEWLMKTNLLKNIAYSVLFRQTAVILTISKVLNRRNHENKRNILFILFAFNK